MAGSPRPRLHWSLFGLGLALAAAAGLWLGAGLWPGWAWLIAIGAVTFALYGFDKASARLERSRVPEMALHVLALCGGTPGALLGMSLFRHKTVKGSFRIVFFAILAVQLALIGGAVYLRFGGEAG